MRWVEGMRWKMDGMEWVKGMDGKGWDGLREWMERDEMG